ncbi:LacI family transcriptional regulator [Pseudonocardia sp. DSM 110487]|uniref:LacI family DNA-binding transcriptional regulator n=1 Tax=Pseudonocardia sp. DSM 110487 TaxID=2865833 RepID=UPI001C694F4C|nr:LacI family DNA-binding transcriptional regulator [Pseudonocardia sp. DSM 110487]QYN36222.1 LacI family transcriptional regulator [Pseudonocardia sp. DSM 110487]
MHRRPRLEDVAAEAGVSTASVSLVLRDVPGPSARTRERVMAAAERLGYRADRTASLLARRRTRLLGVPVLLRDAFRTEMAEEVQVAADARGYAVALSAITPVADEPRVVETLLDMRCEAVLLLAPELPPADLAALGARAPVVVVARHVAPDGFDVVRVADEAGIGESVDHLIGLGHRRIVHVDGGEAAMAADRRVGFRAALHRHGLEGGVLPGGYEEAAGAAAARTLLADAALPTAIVAANDRCALGLLDVFLRAGVRVPQDVSVIGYDDGELARLSHIDLTTVSQEAGEQARQAVAAALERLDGSRTEPVEVVLKPHLVVRGTTAPPRP